MYCLLILVLSVCFCLASSFPDQGQWTRSYYQETNVPFGMHKTLYAGSTVSLSVTCVQQKPSSSNDIQISWLLRQTSCFEEYLGPEVLSEERLRDYFGCPLNTMVYSKIRYIQSKPVTSECSSKINLEYENTPFLTYATDADIADQKVPKGCKVLAKEVEKNDATSAVASDSKTAKDSDHAGDGSNKGVASASGSAAAAVKQRKRRQAEQASGQEKNNQKLSAEGQDGKNKPVENENKKGPEQPPPAKHDNSPDGHKDNSGIKTGTDTKNELKKTTIAEPVHPLPKSPGGTVSGPKVATVDMDGVYLFIVNIESLTNSPFNVTFDVSMKGDYGYLSAVDWPLLPFYGFMCGVYVIYAFAWLFVSALQWRDLLRIQFWIGGVILLGLMEKAVFYAEYQSINSVGQSVQGAVLFAEILSCMKRTLARMLVIIVSLGFGIVKPRLGPMLHRVVGVGGLYFILGTIEGCLRVLKPKNDPSNQALMAGIPLAVTDSAICWWIFSSLVQTIRTLRLRRNVVKLSLYRHFTNTLIFAVVASVAYMIWSIHSHKLVTCITDWKELWVDEAYWHLLFSVVLLVIMILWRPTNNNQRYAFTPLLDAADDEEDGDDMDLNPPNDAFAGMKMRSAKNQPSLSPKQNDAKSKQEDDLKWVEENIPSSLTDTALPSLLDSDEEIMTAKFERSKME